MVYHVFANRSNIGDWLSAKGIQKLLDVDVTECLCDEPFVDETIATLSNATKNDLIVIGGGGLLMDYFIPFWEQFKQVAGKVPFCIWGIGCCDIKHEPSLPPVKLIEEVISKSRYTIVRDELSRSYLSRLDLPAPVACPSINIIEPLIERGRDILHVANYTTCGPQAYDAMRDEAMKLAEEKGVVFRETANRIDFSTNDELEKVSSLYRRSGIVISSALHGCIIAVAMGLKVLAVSGDRKIDAFMETVGLKDWVLDIDELEKIPDALRRLEQQPGVEALLQRIQQQNETVAERIKSLIEEVSVAEVKNI